MSLKIWLPMNGNFENLGTSDIKATATGTSWSTGIHGQCHAMSGRQVIVPFDGFKNTISICFWIYEGNAGQWSDILSFGQYNNRIEKSTTDTTANYNWYTESNGVALIPSSSYCVQIVRNTWTHVCLVADGTKCQWYVNGTAQWNQNQLNSVADCIGNVKELRISGRMGGSNTFTGNIFDFRVYDHAISVKEVKALAQGLICHYKLSDLSGRKGNTNLIVYNSATRKGGWGTGTVSTYDDRTIKLVSPIGWNTFMWQVPSEYIGKNVTLSFWAKKVSAETTSTTANKLLYSNSNASNPYYTGDFSVLDANGTSYTAGGNVPPNDVWIKYGIVAPLNSSGYIGVTVFCQPEGSGLKTTYLLKEIKIESGNTVTEWCPHTSEALYSTLGYADNDVRDLSGYRHDAVIMNVPALTTAATPIYDRAVHTNASGYIKSTQFTITNNKQTVSMWVKPIKESTKAQHFMLGTFDSWPNNGIALYADDNTTDNRVYHAIFRGNSASAHSSFDVTLSCGEWTHITFTYDGSSIRYYKNGVLAYTKSYSGGSISHKCIYLGNSLFNSTPASETDNVCISDFRMYCTCLSDSDIYDLYKTRGSIDNKGCLHGYTMVESTATSICANGDIKSSSFSEIPVYFDKTVYEEPDGSLWIRMFHHNNPASYIFAQNDPFTTPFYKNDNMWWNVPLCNYITTGKWEIMVKQTATSGGTVSKYRWVQMYNPMTATWENVAAANVIKNTSAGYSNTTSYGGIFKFHINSNTYIAANNSVNGNWYGAMGAYVRHQSGIPGYASTVITTGYMDVYLRIDNAALSMLTKASIMKNGSYISAREIIEI